MKTKVNPTLLGAFVVAGLALLVAGVLLFGSGRLFAKPIPFVMVVEGSINGLHEGAAVKFKGVPVGEVRRLVIGVDTNGHPANVQIYAEIHPSRLMDQSGATRQQGETLFLPELVMQGLRASLELESFVTGQLYISLDMDPSSKPPRGLLAHPTCCEVPVETAGLKEFLKSIEDVNVAAMAAKADDILKRLNELLKDLDLAQLQRKVVKTLDGLDAVISAPGATNLLPTLADAAKEAHAMAAALRGQLPPLVGSVTNTASHLATTADRVNRLAEALDRVALPDSNLMLDLSETLDDLSRAATSLRLLADSLRRTPQAILTGRRHDDSP